MAGGPGGSVASPGDKKSSGKHTRRKITRKDIKGAASLPAMIKKLVKRIHEGDAEIKEYSASALMQIAQMDHGQHSEELFKSGAVKPLVNLLSSGAANSQCSAAAALAGIAIGKADHQKAIVVAGGGPALVALLKTGSAKVQEEAAGALATLSANVAYQGDILKAGAIPALVGLLRNGSTVAQAAAAQATANAAAYSTEAQKAIAKAGSIPLLLTLLGVGKAQKPAAGALAKLAQSNREIQDIVAELGGIAPLLALLNGLDVEVQVQAAAALSEMARDNPDTQSAIAKAGGIGPLLAMLSSRVSAAQSNGMACLAQLARNNKDNQDAIARQDGIRPLVQLLESGDDEAEVLSCAACAVMELTRNNVVNQHAIVDVGGISQLANLIKNNRHMRVMSEVAGALWALAEDAEIKIAIATAATISPLVGLLGSEDARATAHAASALASLGLENKSNQVQITQMLIELLSSGSEAAQNRATRSLWALVNENPTAHEAIARAGNPAALVELLKGGIPEAQDYALWSLSLSISSDNQAIVAEAGGVEPLIKQLADKRAEIQKQAAAALAKLACDNEETRSTVAKLGGVKPLITLLKPSAKWDAWAQKEARLGRRNGLAGDTAAAAAAAMAAAAAAAAAAEPAAADPAAADAGASEAPPAADGADGSGSGAGSNLSSSGAAAAAAAAAGTAVAPAPPSPVPMPVAPPPQPKGDPEPVPVHEDAVDALANLASEPAARDEIVQSGGIPHLVALLETRGSKTKKFAALALARLSKDHEVTQSAIAKAGAIASLVALLDGKEGPEAQEAAAGAILSLADHEDNRLTITESGGIGFLVMLLGCTNPRAREHAEGALVRLSIENANRVQIIKKLVDMLQDPGAGGQEQAAAALANLARESENNRQSIVDADGIAPLIELLETASAKAKENAVGAIKELCRNSKNNQFLVAKAGGIAKLVNVLGGFSANSLKESTLVQLITLAASAIKEMAKDNRFNQDAITEAGAIAPLVTMLTAPVQLMQANAAGALANLARHHADNQGAIARTGAVAPLCVLMKEGSDETKDESAWAIWALATNHQGNKDTIAKLGGIDPLLGLLVTGTTDRSQECVAGALTSLAAKHVENRNVIAKRLVGLLGSSAVRTPDRAERVLRTCASFLSDSAPNQVTFAKLGGIPPLIAWQAKDAIPGIAPTGENAKLLKRVQAQAARSMLCLAAENVTTQCLLAKSEGIPPLIALVKKSSPEAQQHAACALWHLASQAENRTLIVDAGAIKPLISMLAAEDEESGKRTPRSPNELAALILVRLARGNADVSAEIAEKAGIVPLVRLLSQGTNGSKQMAASCLTELALVSRNRDMIANAGGIDATTRLLSSPTIGTPEVAARMLAHLAYKDDERDPSEEPTPREEGDMRGSGERRSKMHVSGGISRLITMLGGSHVSIADSVTLEPVHGLKEKEDPTLKVGIL